MRSFEYDNITNVFFRGHYFEFTRIFILNESTSLGYAQNTTHDFQNTVLNSYWHCLRQLPQKLSVLSID